MKEQWFISDTHWGHKNILGFCPSRRQLGADIEAHDEALIQRWNEMVSWGDVIYHLGDVAFGRRKANLDWMKRLNGRIFLLRGNHDTQPNCKWAAMVEDILPSVYPIPGLSDIVLSHAPIHQASMAGRWALNVHGHMHDNVVLLPGGRTGQPDPRYMNISVEQIDFRPIPLEVVLMRLRQIVAGPRRAALDRRYPPQSPKPARKKERKER